MIDPSIPRHSSAAWTDAHRCRELEHPTLLYWEQIEHGVTVPINGCALHVRAGETLMLPPATLVYDDTLSRCDIVVTLDSPALLFATGGFPKCPTLGIGRVVVPKGEWRWWRESIERLQREVTTSEPRHVEAARTFLNLLSITATRYAGVSVPTRGSPRRVVSQVLNHINDHLAAPLGLREIARAVSFSPAYLTDLMKRETGRSVVSWIIELRLQRAEYLLAHTDKPICEIAESVGYTDANSFGRCFTKRRGVSPWQWRRGRRAI